MISWRKSEKILAKLCVFLKLFGVKCYIEISFRKADIINTNIILLIITSDVSVYINLLVRK
jgi:hypothetical protein